MKVICSLVLVGLLTACAPIVNPDRVYLRNEDTNEIVMCEEGHLDSMFDAMSICVHNKERVGFHVIEVSKFNQYGYPIEYTKEYDHFWPHRN